MLQFFKNLSQKASKPLLFGFCGAVGCVIASVAGEAFLAATYRPPSVKTSVSPPQAVVLLIDSSSSMSGGKLQEVKNAATSFIERRNLNQDELAVVDFGYDANIRTPLTSDIDTLRNAIALIKAYGNTNMHLGLEEAIYQLQNSSLDLNILLFTDGQPNDQFSTLNAAQKALNQNVKIIAVATDDANIAFLQQLTQDSSLVFGTTAGKFNEAFEQAEEVIYGKQLVESGPTGDYGIVLGTLRIGGWTGILAIGISLALIIGQNKYQRRRLISFQEASVGTISSIISGIVAGGLGQLVFDTASVSIPILATGGQFVGWLILGTLLGIGISFFVPNLKVSKGLIGGGIGGVLGGVSFLVITNASGALIGRLVGSAIIGFCIGAMIALLEVLSKDARLIIHWSENEKREILLGDRPIVLGYSDDADVYLRKDQGYFPITAKILKENEQIIMQFDDQYVENKGIKKSRQELKDGAKRKLGDVILEIKTSSSNHQI